MKKLMLLAALLAMVLMAALPAIAQVTQEGEQEGESADITLTPNEDVQDVFACDAQVNQAASAAA